MPKSTSPAEPRSGPSSEARKKKLLIFIVAYNAERTIRSVLTRIPDELSAYDTEILIIDDASQDRTFEQAQATRTEGNLPYPLIILRNPVNQGYGGNQKIGFHYAIEKNFDFVALVHGDGQYAPEMLPVLVKPLADGEADAVFGSRMMVHGAALKGGMPLYKFIGNKILTWSQNRLLRTQLSEFHSGYRLYSVGALQKIPFHLNNNQFHFDTEIIIQLVVAGLRIREIPIPTYYGDEICHVDGIKYAGDVMIATLSARAQELGIFYDRKFDCSPEDRRQYRPKLDYPSPHSLAIRQVGTGKRVLDIGCASGYVASALTDQGCDVTGIDLYPPAPDIRISRFIRHDLNAPDLPVDLKDFDYILLLDVIEHLAAPEKFVEQLYNAGAFAPDATILVSTGNIGFGLARLTHLFGLFNYGKRGILDMTHSRLFTFKTLRRLFEQGQFRIIETYGIPLPFPLALGDGWLARVLLAVNGALIRVWKSFFSYQSFMIVKPLPSLTYLLQSAMKSSIEPAQDAAPSRKASA